MEKRLDHKYKSFLLCDRKPTGFSKFAGTDIMKVVVDNFVELPENKYYELVADITPRSEASLYTVNINVGFSKFITWLELTRKSPEVFGPIKLTVSILIYEESLSEMKESNTKLRKELDAARKIFGKTNFKGQEQKQEQDITSSYDELMKKFLGGNFEF